MLISLMGSLCTESKGTCITHNRLLLVFTIIINMSHMSIIITIIIITITVILIIIVTITIILFYSILLYYVVLCYINKEHPTRERAPRALHSSPPPPYCGPAANEVQLNWLLVATVDFYS